MFTIIAKMRSRTTRRSSMAYTLVELVIAVVLTSLLIAGALRWAAAIAQVVTNNVKSGDGGEITLVLSRVGDDVDATRHCDSSGRDALVRELSPTMVRVVTDPDGDGTPAAIYWKLTSDGLVQRGVGTLGADCSMSPPSNWSTMVTGIDPANSWFRPVVAGVESAAEGDYLLCSELALPRCAQPTFTLHLVREGLGEVDERTYDVRVR